MLSSFTKIRSCILPITLALATLAGVGRATDVLSYHNDSQSTGQNLTETILNPSNVAASNFGQRFITSVDGQVYAQPLYKANVNVVSGPAAGVHNLVFVATQHDSVYAIDAQSGNVIWQTSFLTNGLSGATSITTMPSGDTGSGDITPEIGITGTPLIDPATSYLYVAAKTKQILNSDNNNPHYVYTLYKLDITNGNPTANANIVTKTIIADTVNQNNSNTYGHRTATSPTAVQDPFVVGTGYNNEAVTINTQSRVYFNSQRQMNRPGMALYNGNLYIAFASHGDNGPYHGWMLGFDKNTLALTAALNTTPNGGLGGIWQGGGTIGQDGAGVFYFETGNGDFDTTLTAQGFPQKGNYGDCFVRVELDATTTAASQNQNGWGLKVTDYFSPYNNQNLNGGDTDLGSGGPLILPDSAGSAAHRHILLGGGKEGKLYLIDRDSMGKFSTTTDNVVQVVVGAVSGILDTPAYFNSKLYYFGGYGNDVGRVYTITNGQLSAAPVQETTQTFGFAGCTPSISANGTNNGIVWVIDNGSHQLRGYDATNVGTLLYSSNTNAARDSIPSTTKFSLPSVADGQVFVGIGVNNGGGGINALAVYGPPQPPIAPPAAPTNLLASAPSGIQVNLSWNDNAYNEAGYSIEKSPDGINFTQLTTVGVNVSTYQVTGLQVGTQYYFRVRAFNAFQGLSYSAYSNTVAVTTRSQSPSVDFSNGFAGTSGATGALQYNGSAAINGTRMRLTDGGTNETASVFAKGIQNIQRFDTQFTFQLTNPNAEGFTFCIQSLSASSLGQNGGSLGYAPLTKSIAVKFDLFNEAGEGADSTGLYLNGAAPTNAGSVDLTGSGIDLHSGHTFSVALIYDGATLTEIIKDTVTNATFSQSYTVDIPGTLGSANGYIGFTGSTGTQTATQDILGWTYAVLPTSPPAAPSALVAVAASGTEIDLTWSDNSYNEGGFIIQRSTDNGTFGQIQETGANVTTYQDTGLTPGSTFYYRIYATNSIGDSGFTMSVQANTPTPPVTPTNAHATNVTPTEIDFTWQDNSNNETGFRILRSSDGANFNVLALLPPNTTTYQDTPLSPGTTYDYHVQAYNLAGYQDFAGFTQATPTKVSIIAASSPAQEKTSQTASFTVSRLGQTTNPLVITYQVASGAGQASSPTRYTLSPPAPTVTIPAGSLNSTITVVPGNDATVLGTQSVTLNLVAGTGYVPDTTSSALVQVTDAPTTPQSQTSSDQPSSGTGTGNTTNLMQVALAGTAGGNAAPQPVVKVEAIDGVNYLTLSVVRPHPAPSGVTYNIESTGDLASQTWTPAVVVNGYPVDNGDGTETLKARDTQPVASGAQRFIRLRVTQP